jgi:Cysteine dioxygenase type I
MELGIDPADVGAVGPLDPDGCAGVAKRAAALIDVDALDRSGPGSATPLWRTAESEAWLNTWWQPRDSGFHDHGGSCGGVSVIAGEVTGEYLRVEGARRTVRFGAGESFSFTGDQIHRVDHLEGAVTVHVYAPPLSSIGHYELVDGELRREAGAPDEVSPPSHELTRALGA